LELTGIGNKEKKHSCANQGKSLCTQGLLNPFCRKPGKQRGKKKEEEKTGMGQRSAINANKCKAVQ